MKNFLKELAQTDFSGDIGDYTDAIVQAVDNSIYELRPKAVIYPKSQKDIQILLLLGQKHQALNLSFTLRGGGTGTNGQSLTSSLLIDVSRYMNKVVFFDKEAQTVSVQPGVTLEQLNSYLKPLGYFFPPNVSSGSRATIGGMVSTDACGKGSRIYGKTSDWTVQLKTLLTDGTFHTFKQITLDELPQITDRQDSISAIYQQVHHTVTTHRPLIEQTFPKMNRGLSGYNLKHTLQYLNPKSPQQATHLNPCYLIAGSEGTLCIVTEITCKVQPIPKYKAVATVLYNTLPEAISAVPHLLEANPAAIEFIDDKILEVAQNDECWQIIQPLIQQGSKNLKANQPLGGINFIELIAESETQMQENIKHLQQCLQKNQQTSYAASGWYIAQSPEAVEGVWDFRKKAQGLISSQKDKKRSIAFIEDGAVPVEKLPDFVEKLRQLFQQHNVQASIYGHADVGCVHVRPILDLTDASDKKLIRDFSDEVFKLTKSLGGLIWGEHGKGVRGEYNPQVFGKTLYQELQKIKALFDPQNRLNPGKIATPYSPSQASSTQTVELLKLDEVPMRADIDEKISAQDYKNYSNAIHCNGNAACFNWDANEPLCPSYKVTRDKRHSPKGRAMLLREWLNPNKSQTNKDYEKNILPIMNNCFGCGACTHHCPLHVNIPDLRAKFLSKFYKKNSRPIKDYLIAHIETIAPIIGNQSWLARLTNWLQNNTLIQKFILHPIGITALPNYSLPTLEQRINKQPSTPTSAKTQSVILIADCFNRYYDAEVVSATLKLLNSLGVQATLAPHLSSGKAQHIKGFLKQFDKTATQTLQKLKEMAEEGATLIGLDSSVSLIYRNEYQQKFGKQNIPHIHLLQEWLSQYIEALPIKPAAKSTNPTNTYQLLLHCSENTAAPQAGKQWQTIFAHFKQTLTAKKLGCCGMAGSFGHETSNLASSKKAYELSWKKVIDEQIPKITLLASGYSCRSQVQRFSQQRLPHPAEILAKLMP